jgi:C4-dicarboxylate-specific signal transduction histidine kinase
MTPHVGDAEVDGSRSSNSKQSRGLWLAMILVDCTIGIGMLAVISCLGYLCKPGAPTMTIAYLLVTTLFSPFEGLTSSLLFCAVTTLCFSLVVTERSVGFQFVAVERSFFDLLAFVGLSLGLILLTRRLRRLTTAVAWLKQDLGRLASEFTSRSDAERFVQNSRESLAKEMQLSAFSEFSASLAHEIAQPLSAMVLDGQACLRWLRQTAPPAGEIRECVERMTSASRRASSTISRIRDHCRRADPNLQRLRIHEVIAELAPILERELGPSGGRLSLHLASSTPDVLADSVLIRRVFVHLVQASIQTRTEPVGEALKVSVSTEVSKCGWVAVSVSNNGRAMTANEMDAVFGTLADSDDLNLGIHVSVCRSIIEAHGGELRACNVGEGGCTFSFELQLA